MGLGAALSPRCGLIPRGTRRRYVGRGEEMGTSSLHFTMECRSRRARSLLHSLAGDGGYDLDGVPAIGRWLRRVTAPDHIQIATTSAYREAGPDRLKGFLSVPSNAEGLVIFAHG